MSDEKVTFLGVDRKLYEYWVYPLGTNFADKPGNYAFAKRGSSRIEPTYFGETESLKTRLNDNEHERLACAKRNGATLICAHTNGSGRDARLAEVKALRDAYDPPCNRQ